MSSWNRFRQMDVSTLPTVHARDWNLNHLICSEGEQGRRVILSLERKSKDDRHTFSYPCEVENIQIWLLGVEDGLTLYRQRKISWNYWSTIAQRHFSDLETGSEVCLSFVMPMNSFYHPQLSLAQSFYHVSRYLLSPTSNLVQSHPERSAGH